jgi:Fur family transcriptional regulator, stress-responsive regulator
MSIKPGDLLRRHGVQVTAQRLAVLRAVSGRPHITAEAVAEVAKGEIGAISRQSVYDALGVLVDKGIIRRIQPVGSPARYEDRVGDNHHHLICRACGRLVDIDCAVGSAPCLTAADANGFEIDEAEVIYWGRCPECAARDRKSSRVDPSKRRDRNRKKATTRKAPAIQQLSTRKAPAHGKRNPANAERRKRHGQ